MELNQDWKSFQQVFFPHTSKLDQETLLLDELPLGVVVAGPKILGVVSDREDFSGWIGKPLIDLKAQYKHKEFQVFDQADLERWSDELLEQPHFYAQVDFLRQKAKQALKEQKRDLKHRENFLIESLMGWWQGVLPKSFGIYVQLEGSPQNEGSILVFFKNGKIEGFVKPDLSRFRTEAQGLIEGLKEEYRVPVQGLFTSASEWQMWCQSPHPWKDMAMALRQKKAQWVPFKWNMTFLIVTRAFLGL